MTNERQVKMAAKEFSRQDWPTKDFWVCQELKVIEKGRHTIVVQLWNGREYVYKRLEVVQDDPPEDLTFRRGCDD